MVHQLQCDILLAVTSYHVQSFEPALPNHNTQSRTFPMRDNANGCHQRSAAIGLRILRFFIFLLLHHTCLTASCTTWVSWYQKCTRNLAIAEGPRDGSCQLRSCQLPRNSAETTCTTSPEQIEVMKLEG